MKRLLPLLGSMALFAAVAALPVTSVIAADSHNLEQMVTTAKTEAEHHAVATAYEASAKALETQAEEHERMAKVYRGHPGGKGPDLSAHCTRLAANFRESAKLKRQLAEAHHELARPSK